MIEIFVKKIIIFVKMYSIEKRRKVCVIEIGGAPGKVYILTSTLY